MIKKLFGKFNKAAMIHIVFWLSVFAFVWLCTWAWNHWIQQPLIQGEAAIRSTIAALNQRVDEAKNSGNIPSAQKLRREDLMDVNAVSSALQKASNQGPNFALMDISQGETAPASELQNIQSAFLAGKRLYIVNYTTKAKGNYSQLLKFLTDLSQERGIFVQSINYLVGNYPEAIITIKLVVYSEH